MVFRTIAYICRGTHKHSPRGTKSWPLLPMSRSGFGRTRSTRVAADHMAAISATGFAPSRNWDQRRHLRPLRHRRRRARRLQRPVAGRSPPHRSTFLPTSYIGPRGEQPFLRGPSVAPARVGVLVSAIAAVGVLTCVQPSASVEYMVHAPGGTVRVALQRDRDSAHVIAVSRPMHGAPSFSSWRLPYPVYRFETGDVDHDGVDDILVGVVKPTRFDPRPARRIFLFKLRNDGVVPLWLGSRVSQPLEDFRFVHNTETVRTIERERSGAYLVAEYRWRTFGLSFVRYCEREIPLRQARRLLNAAG